MTPAFAVWRMRFAAGIFTLPLAGSSMSTSSDALKRALGVSPESAESAVGLANAHLDSGQYGRAVAAALAALRLRPESADAWIALGVASRYLGAYDKAEAALSRAVELAPRSAEARSE